MAMVEVYRKESLAFLSVNDKQNYSNIFDNLYFVYF